MSKDHICVNHLANLARLNLTEEEAVTFQEQIEGILGFVNKLEELDTDYIEPNAYAAPIFGSIREDVTKPSLDRDAFLDIAPSVTNNQLKVPKVIEEL